VALPHGCLVTRKFLELPARLPILEPTPDRKRRESGRFLERGKLTAAEWRHVVAEASGALQKHLNGGLVGVEPGPCHKELAGVPWGGCGESEAVVTVHTRRAGPEAVVYRTRCAKCGRSDEDVAD
jgi:hypothetical protein